MRNFKNLFVVCFFLMGLLFSNQTQAQIGLAPSPPVSPTLTGMTIDLLSCNSEVEFCIDMYVSIAGVQPTSNPISITIYYDIDPITTIFTPTNGGYVASNLCLPYKPGANFVIKCIVYEDIAGTLHVVDSDGCIVIWDDGCPSFHP